MNTMFEEFYQKYETEEQEVIALIRKCIGAGYHKSDMAGYGGGTQQRKGLGAFAARADLPSEGTQIA